MVATNLARTRGRPRKFDPERGVEVAQALFHKRGYDAVGIAELTQALGINPPSFYAAYGSKAGLYGRILDRYAATAAIPLATILSADRPMWAALAAVLEQAARSYAADSNATGCLVLEGTRSNDADARDAAYRFHGAAQAVIHQYIAERRPKDADRLADYVVTTMAGLSASARHGQSLERLLSSARLASEALKQALPE